jgi:hypothetical protein
MGVLSRSVISKGFKFIVAVFNFTVVGVVWRFLNAFLNLGGLKR